MRKVLILVLLAIVLAFGSCAGQPISPLDMSKLTVFERMVNSVVVLPGCTGIVLKNDGKNSVILTAAHCVDEFQIGTLGGKQIFLPVPISTKLNKETGCLGNVINVMPTSGRDIAVIAVKNCYLFTAVTVLAKSTPKLGGVVYAVGHPRAASYVLTKGIISRSVFISNDTKYLLISAPVIFGNSGGPCFNKNGELVGVVTDIGLVKVRSGKSEPVPLYVGIPHIGLAVPLDEIKTFLRTSGFAELVR